MLLVTSPPSSTSLSGVLHQMMLARGLNALRLAERAGVSHSTLSRMFAGDGAPRTTTVHDLITAMDEVQSLTPDEMDAVQSAGGPPIRAMVEHLRKLTGPVRAAVSQTEQAHVVLDTLISNLGPKVVLEGLRGIAAVGRVQIDQDQPPARLPDAGDVGAAAKIKQADGVTVFVPPTPARKTVRKTGS